MTTIQTVQEAQETEILSCAGPSNNSNLSSGELVTPIKVRKKRRNPKNWKTYEIKLLCQRGTTFLKANYHLILIYLL